MVNWSGSFPVFHFCSFCPLSVFPFLAKDLVFPSLGPSCCFNPNQIAIAICILAYLSTLLSSHRNTMLHPPRCPFLLQRRCSWSRLFGEWYRPWLLWRARHQTLVLCGWWHVSDCYGSVFRWWYTFFFGACSKNVAQSGIKKHRHLCRNPKIAAARVEVCDLFVGSTPTVSTPSSCRKAPSSHNFQSKANPQSNAKVTLAKVAKVRWSLVVSSSSSLVHLVIWSKVAFAHLVMCASRHHFSCCEIAACPLLSFPPYPTLEPREAA